MALKLNIRPEIEKEIESLLTLSGIRSKTEYINQAIADFNQKLKRNIELKKLQTYFKSYTQEGRQIAHDFAKIRKNNF